MKVLDLQCDAQHAFEGWFGSEDDFQSQLLRGLVECPLCANRRVVKMPSAPRLNLGGHVEAGGAAPETESAPQASGNAAALGSSVAAIAGPQTAAHPVNAGQAAFLMALRQLVAQTENVGDRFALEARRIHYGEVEARSIRGQATQRETAQLLEEGIEVMALPLPAMLKETLQ